MEALADAQRFGALLIAAQSYLASGADPAGLSPISASKLGLLARRVVDRCRRGQLTIDCICARSPIALSRSALLGNPAALRPTHRSLWCVCAAHPIYLLVRGERTIHLMRLQLLLHTYDVLRPPGTRSCRRISALGAATARSRLQISLEFVHVRRRRESLGYHDAALIRDPPCLLIEVRGGSARRLLVSTSR